MKKALSRFEKYTSFEKADASRHLAIIYLLLNDRDKAIELMIQNEHDYASAGNNQSRYFRYLNIPFYSILRNDPRFQEILAKQKDLYQKNLIKYRNIEI